MDQHIDPLSYDEMADLVIHLVTELNRLEKELREVRGRMEDAECAVSAFINCVPEMTQIDPRLN